MPILSRSKVEELAQATDPASVSIYMPTHRGGAETQQDPIRLKALLRRAEDELAAGGLRAPDARQMLEPAAGLLQAHDFWQFVSDGLALFISPKMFQYFRLPYDFDETLVVNTRFFIKPLIPLLSGDGRFFVLAISQKQVRLLQGTQHSVDEIYLDNVRNLPRSLSEAMKYDEFEKQTQFHDFVAQGGGKFGRTTIFHGSGANDEENKTNLLRFFKMVNDGLHEILRNEQAPLILAGVDYLLPIYRQANTYPHLLEEGIIGSVERLKPADLHAPAWKIVQPLFEEPQHQALQAFQQLSGEKSGRVSKNIRTIVPAAFHGRVGTLLVTPAARQWGKFDPATDGLQIHERREAGDEDLYDLAVVQTFMNSGDVYAFDPNRMPDHSPAAALFRY